MPWNPEVYHQFKSIRQQPFFDLMHLISPDHLKSGIDLGCGTGEQTAMLRDRFPGLHMLGIDASPEMLAKASLLSGDRLDFRFQTTEQLIESKETWDLIFSNAALQWSTDHAHLFPALLGLLSPRGQFAVQMPMQQDNVLNQILLKLVQEEPFATYLKGWKRDSPVLDMDDYAQLLFEAGLEDLQIFQKVYPIIAPDHDTLIDFISGSTFVPYFERLSAEQTQELMTAFKIRVAQRFAKLPAIYSFKRILMYGRKRG